MCNGNPFHRSSPSSHLISLTIILFTPPSLCNKHQLTQDLVPENGLSWGRGHVTEPQQLWIQGWWNVAHSFITGCRTVAMLAESGVQAATGSGSAGLEATATLSGASNDTHPATLKCLLEQLRTFSNSSSSGSGSGSGSGSDGEDMANMQQHSRLLSSCASFGSHVLLQETSAAVIHTTATLTTPIPESRESSSGSKGTCDDGDHSSDNQEQTQSKGEEDGGGEDGFLPMRVYQVTSHVLPSCSSLAYAMDCELAEVGRLPACLPLPVWLSTSACLDVLCCAVLS